MNALQRLGSFPLPISTPIAALIAAVVVGIAHLIIGDLLGGIPDGFQVDTPAGLQDLLFTSSMFGTFLYTMIGGLVYAIVRRFSANAARIFAIIAAVATLLSLVQPLTLTDAPRRVTATLIALHIIAGIVATSALISLTRPAADRLLRGA